MSLVQETARKMVRGDTRQRTQALYTLAMWFVMGAFVASVAEHYFDAAAVTEQMAALVGGSVSAGLALVIKSV